MSVYFELSWAVLSTIGIASFFFSIVVAAICGFPPISLVPLVVSVAGAVANGLCYYAFYTDYPIANQAAASAFADFLWLVRLSYISQTIHACRSMSLTTLAPLNRFRKLAYPSTAT